MKYTLTLLTLLISSLCFSQQELRQFGIIEVFRGGDSLFIKKLTTRVINVSEGTVTKSRTPPDSAILYLSSDGAVYEGTTVWKKVGGVVVPVTEKIDGELATFVGNWVRTSTNPGWYLNTIAFSNAVGSTASYTFTGTKIELWAERLASHGIGTISIDSGVAASVNFNVAPFGLPVKIFESAILPAGMHTIKLTVGNGYNLLDYFIVTK